MQRPLKSNLCMKELIEKLREKLKEISGVYKDQNDKLYYLIDPTLPDSSDEFYNIRIDGMVEVTCIHLGCGGGYYYLNYDLIKDEFYSSEVFTKVLNSDNYLKINQISKQALKAYIESIKESKEIVNGLEDNFICIDKLRVILKFNNKIFRLYYNSPSSYDPVAVSIPNIGAFVLCPKFQITQEEFNKINKIIQKFYDQLK